LPELIQEKEPGLFQCGTILEHESNVLIMQYLDY
jgi:hypothetical protein